MLHCSWNVPFCQIMLKNMLNCAYMSNTTMHISKNFWKQYYTPSHNIYMEQESHLLLYFFTSFVLLCLCLAEVIWLEMILRLRETSSWHAEQNNLPADTVRFSLGNSRTLLTGVTDLGSVEQKRPFLRWLPGLFFLITRLRDRTDFCGARIRDGLADGSDELDVLDKLLSLDSLKHAWQ